MKFNEYLPILGDKDFLLEKIKSSEGDLVDNKYLRFKFLKGDYQINIFFEKVQINDKNILLKTNRLYLLLNIKNYVVREIDFSKIIKGKEL